MEDWIFKAEFLMASPSRKDGISAEDESKLRSKSVSFIEFLAKELKLHRFVASTACVLFHRFFAFQSFKQHSRLVRASPPFSPSFSVALFLFPRIC